jgi:SAM-dependent methyltransferase
MEHPDYSISEQLNRGLFRANPLSLERLEDGIVRIYFNDLSSSRSLTSEDNIQEYTSSGLVSRYLFNLFKKYSAWWSSPNFSKECIAAENAIRLESINKLLVEIGGGPVRSYGATNLNVYPWPNVDIVGDAHSLPYCDSSVDNIMSRAVLEHLSDPQIAVNEMYRVLKNEGLIFLAVPFLQPYHGYPDHYRGLTKTGLEFICENAGFTRIDSGSALGPCWTLNQMVYIFLQTYLPLWGVGRVIASLWRLTIGLFISKFDIFINQKNSFIMAFGVFYLGRKG